MGINRELSLDECQPETELAFSLEEFQHRPAGRRPEADLT